MDICPLIQSCIDNCGGAGDSLDKGRRGEREPLDPGGEASNIWLPSENLDPETLDQGENR